MAVTRRDDGHRPAGRADRRPGETLGIEGAYASLWSVLRWPLGLALVVGFLVCLYRFSANVRHCWRDCLPGARRRRDAVDLRRGRVPAHGRHARLERRRQRRPVVTLIGQAVNAVVSTVLWAYLASIAILLGGEFNALLRQRRAS